MRFLICGGRDYMDRERLFQQLDHFAFVHDISCIIHGAAPGADSMARNWALSRNVPVEEYPADWKAHGKMAGPLRNLKMLLEGRPDLVVAFPGGIGTADMVKQARRRGVRVVEILSSDKENP